VKKRKLQDQISTMVTTIAAIPKMIPIMEEIPIRPVAFLNRKRLTTPSRTARMARMTVRIPHDRKPRIKLKIPSRFPVRFGAAAGTGAGTGALAGNGPGTADAGVTG
jgi:hypothetical protein